MKNIKVQEDHGKCGLYNLANVLRDEEIIELYENDKKFIPCGPQEVNKILTNEGYEFKFHPIIEPLNWEIEVPIDFFNTIIHSAVKNMEGYSTHILPLILSVQAGSSKFGLHAISLMYYNGKFAISDPRDEEFKIIESIDDILGRYKYINSINGFTNKDGAFVALNSELYDTSIFN